MSKKLAVVFDSWRRGLCGGLRRRDGHDDRELLLLRRDPGGLGSHAGLVVRSTRPSGRVAAGSGRRGSRPSVAFQKRIQSGCVTRERFLRSRVNLEARLRDPQELHTLHRFKIDLATSRRFARRFAFFQNKNSQHSSFFINFVGLRTDLEEFQNSALKFAIRSPLPVTYR